MAEFSAALALEEMPEVFVSGSAISREVSRAVKAAKLRKLASRLYTKNLKDDPETIVLRHVWDIVGGYFPGALIADRTALENVPAEDGSIFLVTERGNDVQLPGLRLRPRRGLGPLPTDRSFIAGLFLSSTARAYLENMRPSRARGGRVARTLSRRQIEDRLDTLIRLRGEEVVKVLRDEVRVLAPALGLEDEAAKLDAVIATLRGTRDEDLTSPSALARRAGRPFDPVRLDLFQSLHAALRNYPPIVRLAPLRSHGETATLAFFEAYFSNFIEGTEFDVDSASDIVFRGLIPSDRPEDAHDVLGTWRIVSDVEEMRRVPSDAAALIRLLKTRHASIMERRPDKRPGEFKQIGNRAGSTVFVAPDLVAGTLEKGFELCRSLESAFQRAVLMMFLIAEVHPFVDGNGRTARVMMNAELVAAGEERIVIPTIYRSHYLTALKATTQSGRTEPLIRMLDFAQKWTAAIDWRTVAETRPGLDACNAFLDPSEADEQGKRLRMPNRVGS